MNTSSRPRQRRSLVGWAIVVGLVMALGGPGCRSVDPWYPPLHAAVGDATRVEVRDTLDGALLFALDDRAAIADLVARIEVDPTNELTCRCPGEYALDFIGGARPARLTLHHMMHLRLGGGGWPADGMILPQSLAAVTDWFAAHGFERFELERVAADRPGIPPTRAWYRILRHWPEAGRAAIAAVDSDALSTDAGLIAFAESLAAEMGRVEMAVAAMRALGRSGSTLALAEPLELPAWAVFAAVDGEVFVAALQRVADDQSALLGAARVAFDADWLDLEVTSFDSDVLDDLDPTTRDRWMAAMAGAVFASGRAADRALLSHALLRHGGPACHALLARRAPDVIMSLPR